MGEHATVGMSHGRERFWLNAPGPDERNRPADILEHPPLCPGAEDTMMQTHDIPQEVDTLQERPNLELARM